MESPTAVSLRGKNILLGVTGSIAAYKAALLVRLLAKQGANTKVVMTPAALDFITPLTLATLSKNPVLTGFTKNEHTGEWNNHVALGLWADALVVAPASANTLAKMTTGLCDNLLLAAYLSARCPVFVAPAMDLDMYAHPTTVSNLDKLRGFGHHVLEAEHGELASGLVGTGRMAEPERIVDSLSSFFTPQGKLKGRRVLITAGPTQEALDPVRFIGNHSSGKMGFALAEAAADQGAEVSLVSGPTGLSTSHPGVRILRVTSAEEMYQKCAQAYPQSDINIFAAAVADYRPEAPQSQKIKKSSPTLTLVLHKTTDIAAELGKSKRPEQINVGFALETDNEQENAQQKLAKKNFDLIVLNSLKDPGAGFGHDTNKVTLIDRENNVANFELMSKQQVANNIIDAIIAKTNA